MLHFWEKDYIDFNFFSQQNTVSVLTIDRILKVLVFVLDSPPLSLGLVSVSDWLDSRFSAQVVETSTDLGLINYINVTITRNTW